MQNSSRYDLEDSSEIHWSTSEHEVIKREEEEEEKIQQNAVECNIKHYFHFEVIL